jgi:adenylyltransferase/sulfurtransferase
MGTMQGVEAIKLLLGIGRPLVGRLLQYDALAASVREFEIPQDPACPSCAPGCRPLLFDASACAVPASVDSGISVAELKRMRELGEPLRLVDVRTPAEHKSISIGNDLLIPLADLPGRLGEIPKDVPVVLYCLSGVRSAKAVELLASVGVASARSLRGGILAWKAVYEEGA